MLNDHVKLTYNRQNINVQNVNIDDFKLQAYNIINKYINNDIYKLSYYENFILNNFNFYEKYNIKTTYAYNMINKLKHNNDNYNLIIFYNGTIVHIKKPETWFLSFQHAEAIYPNIIKNNLTCINKNIYELLNIAFFKDSIFIYIPKNINIYRLHIANIIDNKTSYLGSCYKIFIITNENNCLHLKETHISNNNKTYVSNSMCNILIKENSQVHHQYFMQGNNNNINITNTNVTQNHNSAYKLHYMTYSGKYLFNTFNINLKEKNASCNMYCTNMIGYNQKTDMHIKIIHNATHGISLQKIKNIYGQKSSGNFHGNIIINNKSNKSKADQLNNNLFIANDINVSTSPTLEINASDIECSHGTTISKINKNQLFFLQSRCINKHNAIKILLKAFILENFQVTNNILKFFQHFKINDWIDNNLRDI